LVAVLAVGQTSHGAQRWLGIGPLTFQPSEVSKIALAMVLARYFSGNPNYTGYGPRELVLPALITLVPVGLILAEPDLGTALIHLLVFLTVALFMRVRSGVLWLSVALSAVLVPAGWLFVLKDYQKERILTLFDPGRDPLGSGYHIRQSIIAVGSGQWFGKGFLHGTQTKLQFLPEHHTDFIFSVFAEEWGFAGGLVLLGLYFALLIKGVAISVSSKDRYGSILAAGLSAILFWHVVINLMMVVGLAPVVGVTLPFFSYGRTSLITMMLLVGLLMNVSSRRYIFEQM
jgi:rod shape determining protein RodA